MLTGNLSLNFRPRAAAGALSSSSSGYRTDGTLLSSQYTPGITIEPDWTWLYYNHSYGWKDTGNWSEGSYRVDLYVVVEKLASGSFEIYGESSTDIYLSRGVDYYKKGKYDEADKDASLLIYKNGSSVFEADAYNLRGMAKYNKGKFEWALNDFRKAIELAPKYSEAYNNRGNMYYKLNQKASDLGLRTKQ